MSPEDRCLAEIAHCQEELLKPDLSDRDGVILGCLDWGLELMFIRGDLRGDCMAGSGCVPLANMSMGTPLRGDLPNGQPMPKREP